MTKANDNVKIPQGKEEIRAHVRMILLKLREKEKA